MPRFLLHTGQIRRQLRTSAGLVGYSLRARIAAKHFWTLSAWEDETVLRAFAAAPPHAAVMKALAPHRGATRFMRWTIKGSDLPLQWEDAPRSELDAAAEEIARQGGRARALPLDVTDSAAVRDAIAGLGRLDILRGQSAAALSRSRRGNPRSAADAQRARCLYRGAGGRPADGRAKGRRHRQRLSQMGHVGSERDRTVYVMTKHALEGLTKAMAVNCAPRVSASVSIAPTFIATPWCSPFSTTPPPANGSPTASRWAASARSRKSRTRSSSSLPPPPASSPAPPSSPTAAGPPGKPGADLTWA